MEMAGAVLGVLIQKVLPNWLYLLAAVLVFGFMAQKMYKKYRKVRQKEQEVLKKKAAANSSEPTPVTSGASANSNEKEAVETSNKRTLNTEVSANDLSEEEEERLRKAFLEEDMVQFPKDKLLALLVLWVGLFVLTLMKGGKGVDSVVGIDCKSPVYYVLIVLQFLWLFGIAIFFGVKLVKKQAERVAVRYPYLPHDPKWEGVAIRNYGALAFAAGIVAGLIGTGGGVVLSPLMVGGCCSCACVCGKTVLLFTRSLSAVIRDKNDKLTYLYLLCRPPCSLPLERTLESRVPPRLL